MSKVGAKGTPKKDKGVKVTAGQIVKCGQLLTRHINTIKPGANVKGINSLSALCAGKVCFKKKRTPSGKIRAYLAIEPTGKKSAK